MHEMATKIVYEPGGKGKDGHWLRAEYLFKRLRDDIFSYERMSESKSESEGV
jgi:hypothetical protein